MAVDRNKFEALFAQGQKQQRRCIIRGVDIKKVYRMGEQDIEDAEAAFHRAEASVTASRAALESARINLAWTPIKAPISGRTGRSSRGAHQQSPSQQRSRSHRQPEGFPQGGHMRQVEDVHVPQR